MDTHTTLKTATTSKRKQTYVGLSRDERGILEELAERNGRSISGQIRFLLRPILTDREIAKGEQTP